MSVGEAVAAGFRVVNEGVPDQGVVLHYAQIHNVTIPGADRPADGCPTSLSRELLMQVARCQRKIFDDLVANRIEHIFYEGLDRTKVPDTFEPGSADAILRDKVQAHLRGYKPGMKLDPDKERLFACGASLLYPYVTPGVTMHPTTTAKEIAKRDAYLLANRDLFKVHGLSFPASENHLFLHGPEQDAVTFMKQVMRGKSMKVALISGKTH